MYPAKRFNGGHKKNISGDSIVFVAEEIYPLPNHKGFLLNHHTQKESLVSLQGDVLAQMSRTSSGE